jgi:hypothetical protein
MNVSRNSYTPNKNQVMNSSQIMNNSLIDKRKYLYNDLLDHHETFYQYKSFEKLYKRLNLRKIS